MILNTIASVLIVLGMSFFVFKGFKKKDDNIINKLPTFERLYLKTSIILVLIGATSNIVISYNPRFSEITLNIGIGMLLSWSVFFYLKYLIKNKK
jgi:purine-cytosine permease-like protein